MGLGKRQYVGSVLGFFEQEVDRFGRRSGNVGEKDLEGCFGLPLCGVSPSVGRSEGS